MEPGEYFIEIDKPGFVSPSRLLLSAKEDGQIVDLYHGEKIIVDENSINITPNIPVDPVGESRPLKRVAWEARLRVIQHVVSIFGVIATLIALYITPTWYIAVFLGVHLILYLLFVSYIKPKKPKGWGIVYDKSTQKPLNRVVARLFSKKYNKLVESKLTDKGGRYAFMAGPSDYYVTYEKEGYHAKKSGDIVLKGEEDVMVKNDVVLEKVGSESIKSATEELKVEEKKSDLSGEDKIALDQSQQDEVKVAISKATGIKKIVLSTSVDESLIGGLIVKIGSKMIDNSIKTKLNRLEIAMRGVN